MTFQIKEGRYVAAMFFLFAPDNTQDWHGIVWRERPGDIWHFDYRFRYYMDDKAHDSEDEKSWYACTMAADATEAFVMSVASGLADTMTKSKTGGYNSLERSPYYGADVHKVILRSSNVEDIMGILKREKFIHSKFEPMEKKSERG